MSLQANIMADMKAAMKAKDTVALTTLRAIKAEFLKAKTAAGSTGEMSEAEELKMLQKMAKQRKDAAAIYIEQDRQDLADTELEQIAVLERYLPEQMSPEKLEESVKAIVDKLGASGMADMGKVMGVASKELSGKADGKAVADVVKSVLSSL